MLNAVSYMAMYSSNNYIIPHIHDPTTRMMSHNQKRFLPHNHNTATRMILHSLKPHSVVYTSHYSTYNDTICLFSKYS